jgi:hypothetical protein
MTLVIATMRSLLQTSISSVEGQFVALSARGGGVLLSDPNKDTYSGSLISSLMVTERKSRFKDNEYASYVVPDDAIIDILHRFKCILD